MKKSTCLALSFLAGSTLSAVALAQPGNSKLANSKQARPRAILAEQPRLIHPAEYRAVRLVNNRIEPLGDWIPYSPSAGDAGTPTLCFDAYHTFGGQAPSTPPGGGRWTFSWTSGVFDYTGSGYATPINSISPAAVAAGAKYFDYVYYENQGPQDEYTAIFTCESYFDNVAPDGSWGTFPGWQFHYVGVTTGAWYSNLTLTDPQIWPLPADGSGAVITKTTRDAAGLVPAQQYQLSQWGTQEHTTPPPSPALVGTSGPMQWAESSTAGVCATSLATNVADGIYQIACEVFAWTYGPSYPQDPMTLCIAIGFDAPSGCYANCDGSTGVPVLTGNDFVCFINNYANASTAANCDGSTGDPLLTGNDFVCFINAFAAGCS